MSNDDVQVAPGIGHAGLSAPDAEALDALMDAGLEPERVPAALRPRAARVAGILALLGHAAVDGRDRRVARVMGAVRTRADGVEQELCGDDAEALDAWVLAGFDASKVAGSLRARARAHQALADLVQSTPPVALRASDREGLIARTLAGVEQAEEINEEHFRLRAGASRVRWSDLLSVAAVFLIAASVLWPVLSTVRDSARRSLCGANMREVARALGGYSYDNDQMLPMATAGFAGGTWWNVGRDPSRSNSANFYTLARQDYVGLAAMACPGNPHAVTAPRSADARDWSSLEELSYSYRVMANAERELWGSPDRIVIVADRSPVVLRAVRGQTIYPHESSPNHAGRGQHGLMADGSAEWLESPVLASGDNIWLPKPIEILIDVVSRRVGLEPLQGTEAPADREDSFVGP
ncbi:MAG TPA: hypothetical protein VFF69_04410 [Phycisphaerales bacterium]|nr:hypothetical protein [Phycisphaerales bacterium]